MALTPSISMPPESVGGERLIHCQGVAFFRVDAKQEISSDFVKKRIASDRLPPFGWDFNRVT